MTATAILYPAFAHVVLTTIVLVVMGQRRAASMRAKNHTFEDVALGHEVWTDAATKASRNYANQFEFPVFFHAGCAMALAAKVVDPTLVWLAWAFVASRAIHTAIHLGANKVSMRGAAFLVGILIVVAMWIIIVWRAT